MKKRKSFNEMDEGEYLFGKLTNDGGYNHRFIEEQRLPYRRRRKIPDSCVDVDVSVLEKKDENAKNQDEIQRDKGIVEPNETAKKTPQRRVKMTLRELFNHYYDGYSKMKWKERWSKMMKDFAPYIEDQDRRKEFLLENFKRKRHNENARKLRMNRKMSINGFNYFVTFTYDDEKMTAEQFKKKLKAYLKNNVSRLGWKYIGVWEGWDGSVRLHFHALMYIEENAIPGTNIIERKYNPVSKQMETHTRNTEFNEKFGLSTIEKIIPEVRNRAYDYITKYMNKGGKMMMSRNCPTFIKGWMKKEHLICPINEDETSYVTAADAEMVMETGEILKLESNGLHKVLPKATTCN